MRRRNFAETEKYPTLQKKLAYNTMSNTENPFAVSRLGDDCLTQKFVDKIARDLSVIDQLLQDIDPKKTRDVLQKVKQSQKMLHANLLQLKQGLERHKMFEYDYSITVVNQLKQAMLLPLKSVPWKSGREKSLHTRNMEKKKEEARQKGRSKKKAKLDAILKGHDM